nr:reverse transcriptase domain-containing protein [Tanacetum cinerariifolium]
MSTRSSARNLFPPLDNPELTIRRRSHTDPTLLNNSKMAAEGNGDPPVPDLRTMEELCQPSLNGRGGPIALIAIQATNFELKNDMIQQSIKVNGVTDDTLRLYIFPHSLTHHATAWFDHLPRNSVNTFEEMAKMFLALKAKMAKINKNLMRVLQVNQQVKAVTPSSETCGGPHSFNDFPATVGNTQSVYATGAYQELVDRLISRSVGVVENVFVKVGTFHFPADFVVVDFVADPRVPLILERSFLKTGRALIDVFEGELTLCVGKEAITFNLYQTSRYTANYNDMTAKRIDVIDMDCEEYSQEVLGFSDEKTTRITVLKSYKRAIAWKLSDIKGIDPEFCTHKILMEEDFEPAVQHQRRVNLKIYDVIKNEVLKLLDAGFIYSISDSPWVSPVHCVPKKGGFTVVENERNELILTHLVTGWRVCIDYRKLNEATRKDHFPLPFMDQMLERLARNQYYCFLDCFSDYFQIPVDPKDQEKTTFTCPYGTFVYRRMSFGICNAPGMFQRCMMAIFHDMIEKTMEVFMDDFSVFENSFQAYLSHLEKMLKRCEDTNLCQNWEKSHFMVKEGIVLGHKISKNRIKVDKAKVDVIAKLPHPITVKGIRSFLGHASFYR